MNKQAGQNRDVPEDTADVPSVSLICADQSDTWQRGELHRDERASSRRRRSEEAASVATDVVEFYPGLDRIVLQPWLPALPSLMR